MMGLEVTGLIGTFRRFGDTQPFQSSQMRLKPQPSSANSNTILFHCLRHTLPLFSGAMLTPFLANVLVKRSLVLAVSIYGAMGLAAASIAFLFLPESRDIDMS